MSRIRVRVANVEPSSLASITASPHRLNRYVIDGRSEVQVYGNSLAVKDRSINCNACEAYFSSCSARLAAASAADMTDSMDTGTPPFCLLTAAASIKA